MFTHNPTIAYASLGFVEVMATLARKEKAQEIEHSIFAQKIQELEEDWEHFIQIHLTTEVVHRAKDLAKQQALRGADAVHLASALLLQSRFVEEDDQLIFVTSDRELKEAARSSALEVVDPDEEERKIESPEEL